MHNANYLLYCEVGRIEYFKHIGLAVDMQSITGSSKIVLVRNEIDYKLPARFDDLLNIFTRVSFIKNTSFGVEGILEREGTGEIIAENIAYHVWLDPSTDRPVSVPEHFRGIVRKFEGANCEILQLKVFNT
ncbi:MAG: acyl-CoA thioesterase [Ignavibacteriae bacterium]|nr:acyl-CoA thioesterase [Ignavibacteriota bacterium]